MCIRDSPITVRTDHKSISFLKNCRLKHGRLTRWTLTLQEYNIQWEYIPGKSNIAADVLSRVNINAQTFEGEKETIAKVYHILKNTSELTNILSDINTHQNQDPKVSLIIQRLANNDEKITQFYCTHNQLLFTKHNKDGEKWKVVIPKTLEKELTIDYHIRYGHMGAVKVVKALQEHVHFKDMNRKVRKLSLIHI